MSNLKRAFRKGIEYQIPKEIINQISKRLPEGLEYVQLGESGLLKIIASEEPETRIRLKAKMSEATKGWEISSPEEYFEMLYRTQTSMEIEDGSNFIVNGKEVPYSDFVKKLFGNEIIKSSYHLVPHEFDPPFEMELKGDGLTKILLVRRQPLADLKRMKFQNVDGSAIEISFIYHNETQKMTFTININTEKVSSVQEMLDDLQIYDAVAAGRGEIWGNKLPSFEEHKIHQDSFKDLIQYWKKIKELENHLGVTFELKFPLDKEDILVLAELYRCLIEKKPFKEGSENISVSMTPSPDLDTKKMIDGQALVVKYSNLIKFEILGCEFELYTCHGLFDIKIKEMNNDPDSSGNIEITLESEDDKRMYRSTMCFHTLEEADMYVKNHVEELRNATSVKM